MRVVLDVNVWISAWLWGGVPGHILLMVQNQQAVGWVERQQNPTIKIINTSLATKPPKTHTNSLERCHK